jgi:hypothetical protein
LHFEGDRYAIGVFKFGMVVRQEPPISKELDVPDLQDICSAQVSLRHLKREEATAEAARVPKDQQFTRDKLSKTE